ncbi:MAG: sensor histidine kinase, partial [Verrucomicrobiota bacterium]
EDPVQRGKLIQLEPLIAVKVAAAKKSIAIEPGQSQPLTSEAALEEGKVVMDAIRRVIGEMESVERERLARRSADARRTFHITMVIVSLSAGMAVLLAGIASVIAQRDYNRRRQAEEERDRFFTLTRDLVCFAGFDGYFKLVNPAWERVLGYAHDELLARPFVEFVHPEDRAITASQAEKLSRGVEVIQFENRYRAKDGSYHWFSWNARASVSAKAIYATARDITEQKHSSEQITRLNADLQQRAAELEEANKELEAFSYSVSHDLRAPLRHIGGFVSQLEKSGGSQLDEKSRRYLKIISDAARQMGALIDDLLLFSRMARTEMQNRPVNLTAVAEGVIASLEEETRQRKIVWKSQPLPQIQGDPAMLRQVFVNLMANAVKYTRPREQAEIEIGCTENAEEFVFYVRDNGVGFEMEFAHKLFGVFQRLHRDEEFEGTGIGLANVRRIVRRHGGNTWAEGKVNEGATFYFTIPKHKKATA